MIGSDFLLRRQLRACIRIRLFRGGKLAAGGKLFGEQLLGMIIVLGREVGGRHGLFIGCRRARRGADGHQRIANFHCLPRPYLDRRDHAFPRHKDCRDEVGIGTYRAIGADLGCELGQIPVPAPTALPARALDQPGAGACRARTMRRWPQKKILSLHGSSDGGSGGGGENGMPKSVCSAMVSDHSAVSTS